MSTSTKDPQDGPNKGVFANLLDEADDDHDAPAEEPAAEAPQQDPPILPHVRDTLEGVVASTLPWPPRPEVPDSQRVEHLRPPTDETEGILRQVPDLGAMPYATQTDAVRRVARLVSSAGDGDLSIELQPGTNLIGRQRNENHIVLVSPDISRFHARIEVHDDSIEVTDLDSSNGTFINGERVQQGPVEAGDIIAFSDEFSFQVLIDIPLESPETMTLTDEMARASTEGTADTVSLLSTLGLDGEQGAGLFVDTAPGYEVHATANDTLPQEQWPAQEQAASGARSLIPDPAMAPDAAMSGTEVDEETNVSASPSAPRRVPTEAAMTLPVAEEMVELERERRQLAVLYQVSRRCMEAMNLDELDRLLINVLERMVAFHRGFITYQLPNGDWKLVMSKHKYTWERKEVRGLLQTALKRKQSMLVVNSQADQILGANEDHSPDSRLLVPLRARDVPLGAIFLVSQLPDSLDGQSLHFLELFAEIAALSVDTCGRLA